MFWQQETAANSPTGEDDGEFQEDDTRAFVGVLTGVADGKLAPATGAGEGGDPAVAAFQLVVDTSAHALEQPR